MKIYNGEDLVSLLCDFRQLEADLVRLAYRVKLLREYGVH